MLRDGFRLLFVGFDISRNLGVAIFDRQVQHVDLLEARAHLAIYDELAIAQETDLAPRTAFCLG